MGKSFYRFSLPHQNFKFISIKKFFLSKLKSDPKREKILFVILRWLSVRRASKTLPTLCLQWISEIWVLSRKKGKTNKALKIESIDQRRRPSEPRLHLVIRKTTGTPKRGKESIIKKLVAIRGRSLKFDFFCIQMKQFELHGVRKLTRIHVPKLHSRFSFDIRSTPRAS